MFEHHLIEKKIKYPLDSHWHKSQLMHKLINRWTPVTHSSGMDIFYADGQNNWNEINYLSGMNIF